MLAIIDSRDLTQQEIDKWHSVMPRTRCQSVLKKKNKTDIVSSILGDLLIIDSIVSLTGCKHQDIIISYNEHQKPICQSHDVHFSVAHKDNTIVCIAEKALCGIDIETVKPIKKELLKRVLTPNEQLYFDSDGKPYSTFFEIWTAKEAYLKLLGVGISGGLTSYEVDITKKEINGVPYNTIIHNNKIITYITL